VNAKDKYGATLPPVATRQSDAVRVSLAREEEVRHESADDENVAAQRSRQCWRARAKFKNFVGCSGTRQTIVTVAIQ
jgi:hypothetical protein